MYVKQTTQRVYKKGDNGFALCHVDGEQWDQTDTPNDELDSEVFDVVKPKRASKKDESPE